jgi:hypothetical protein
MGKLWPSHPSLRLEGAFGEIGHGLDPKYVMGLLGKGQISGSLITL